jgi:hypothetical protein
VLSQLLNEQLANSNRTSLSGGERRREQNKKRREKGRKEKRKKKTYTASII